MLNQDELMVTRDAEVERVLRCFHLNPYEILDLDFTPGAVNDDIIRKTYRKRSLLIHPDKLKHPRAVEAFDLLKKVCSPDLCFAGRYRLTTCTGCYRA